ncbi:DNA cytosine methyltransferase [Streptomyces sp. DSM 42041]|uniref:DNA (cytosine-5-)-methyltransferase n=1 Tax=Streptomyces hazeniae TaxID=3075538 RepID=A0ABU2NJP6_9ACTN|nr:DNA cytosine methyltransferase [Streptomyces sp. DSM 42041]MDT0377210.1 DNA cytosine methyltransferase [Streptomyces sp. DSM 42041]
MVDLPEHDQKTRTSVELFAGGGGLAMAVDRAGFRPLLFNEYANYACQTLADNGAEPVPAGEQPEIPKPGQPVPLVPGDVQKLDMTYLEGEVDLLAGGPPCQPFSLGGVAKGDEDKRNMFPHMFRAIREMRPKAVICENVRGLLRPSFRDYFKYIQRELELPFMLRRDDVSWQEHDRVLQREHKAKTLPADERYHVVVMPVNAANYGVPQVRQRVIMVAFREDLNINYTTFEKHVQNYPFSEAALHRAMRQGDYWQRFEEAGCPVPDHVIERTMARLPEVITEVDDQLKPWRTLRDAVTGLGTDERLPALPPIDRKKLDRKTNQGGKITDHIGWPDARIYAGHTPNELDRPAKTVKAGVHGVPGGESVMLLDERERDTAKPGGWRYVHRYMTVRETARVMTFPDEWKAAGPRGERMRQLGNAVPVVLGEFFARAVAEALANAGK